MSNRLIRQGVMASIQATATGDNVVIAGQGTHASIIINAINVVVNTATANMVGTFQLTGSTGSYFANHLITKGQRVDIYFGDGANGWMLPKNIGLDFNMATGGSIAVDVLYSVVDDL